MLDLSLPQRTSSITSEPVLKKGKVRLVEAEYQPLKTPLESECVLIKFEEYDDKNDANKTPSIRFLNGTLAPPNRQHEFVRNYEVQGMQPGLSVRVSHGELFSQYDVEVWFCMIAYMMPHNWQSCIVAKDLLKQRGINNPSGEDYILQKMSITRFARMIIEIKYTGAGRPFHYTGSLIAVGDYSAEGSNSGAVYYDDLRAEKCGGDGYLGRLDRFSVHIRPEIVEILEHKELKQIVNIDRQKGITASRLPTQFESWLTYKLTSLRKVMSKPSGFDTSISRLINDCGSKLPIAKFEVMAKPALDYVVTNGWAGSYKFYTTEAGERRVVLCTKATGAAIVVNRIEYKTRMAKRQAELRGDLIVSK